MSLTQQTIDTVKATVPALKEHGAAIISNFYETLFERYPSVRAMFNMDRQKGGTSVEDGVPTQVSRLAGAVLAYAKHIDNVQAIMPVVVGICHKHVARGVIAPQYDAVGECLLAAIKNVLGEAATDDIMDAWGAAYDFLATAFIDTERNIRKQLAEEAGFEGFVDMRVSSVDEEAATGETILGFVPLANNVPPCASGQFVAIQLTLDDGTETMTTMAITDGEVGQLNVRVRKSKEKASIKLANSSIDDEFSVSMPCGVVKS